MCSWSPDLLSFMINIPPSRREWKAASLPLKQLLMAEPKFLSVCSAWSRVNAPIPASFGGFFCYKCEGSVMDKVVQQQQKAEKKAFSRVWLTTGGCCVITWLREKLANIGMWAWWSCAMCSFQKCVFCCSRHGHVTLAMHPAKHATASSTLWAKNRFREPDYAAQGHVTVLSQNQSADPGHGNGSLNQGWLGPELVLWASLIYF